MFMHNKKGSIDNIIFFLESMIGIGIVFVIMWMLLSNFNATVQDSDDFPEVSKTSTQGLSDSFVKIFDWAAIILAVVLIIGSVILGFNLRTNPAYLTVYILILVALIFVSVPVSNIWQEFVLSPLGEYMTAFGKLNWLMEHLPLYTLVFGIINGIAIYSTRGTDIEQFQQLGGGNNNFDSEQLE